VQIAFDQQLLVGADNGIPSQFEVFGQAARRRQTRSLGQRAIQDRLAQSHVQPDAQLDRRCLAIKVLLKDFDDQT